LHGGESGQPVHAENMDLVELVELTGIASCLHGEGCEGRGQDERRGSDSCEASKDRAELVEVHRQATLAQNGSQSPREEVEDGSVRGEVAPAAVSADIAELATPSACSRSDDPHPREAWRCECSAQETLEAESCPFPALDSFAFDGVVSQPSLEVVVPANANAAIPQGRLRRVVAKPLAASASSAARPAQQADACAVEEDFETMSEPERQRIRSKWWAFAREASTADEARLYLVVAAILHAKAAEVVVRRRLEALRSWALGGAVDGAGSAAGGELDRRAAASLTVARHVFRDQTL